MAAAHIIIANEKARQTAIEMVKAAPEGHLVKVAEPTRTERQNRLLHPLLRAIVKARPNQFHSIEDAKLIFLDALKGEMTFLPKLDGSGHFPAGRKTSNLSVRDFNDLVELVNAYAAQEEIELPAPPNMEAA